MLGAPKPADVDPTGEFYTFEKGVEKTGGGKGFADGLRDRGVDPQEAAHFLNKLLFCLFAEDILENLLALNLERSGD